MIILRFPYVITPAGFRLFHSAAAISCLLGAVLLWSLPRWLRTVVIAAVLIDSGMRSFVLLENMRLDSTPGSTRASAAAWLEAHVAPGRRVGMLVYPEPAHTPVFPYNRYELMVFTDPQSLAGRPLPDFLILDSMTKQSMEAWGSNPYDLAARFPAYRAGWAPPSEDVSFANAPFYIYRRRGAL
jgi:hypothetical protein